MRYTRVIKKKGSFRYLFNKGKVSRGKIITIFYSYLNKDYNTFGICVSKKNGNSVSRNKLKRWVREVYKEQELSLKKGLNIVFLVKKDVTFKTSSYHDIKEEIEDIFRKENLYENS